MSTVYTVGSINLDLVVRVPRFPQPGETLPGGELQLVPGGKGANQACAAARLGGRSVLCAGIGNDVFAGPALEALRSAGVDTSRVREYDGASGTALIAVRDNGENNIIISAGANGKVTVDDATDALHEAGPGDVLLLQLETPLEVVLAAAARAADRGCTTILDPAPVQPLSAELLQAVHFLTPNQTEAALLLGSDPIDAEDSVAVKRAAEALLATGPKCVVLKLGEHGCVVQTAERAFRVAAFPMRAVDTTAAGDTFNGAFAVALCEGLPLERAAVFASAAAALSVTRHGAQSSIPKRDEVNAFLATQALPPITVL